MLSIYLEISQHGSGTFFEFFDGKTGSTSFLKVRLVDKAMI